MNSTDHDAHTAPDEIVRKFGTCLALNAFAESADGDPTCLEVGHTIVAQMGLNRRRNNTILSTWAIWGKHRAGGALLFLDLARTKQHGDFFTVSYNRRTDDYTVSYAGGSHDRAFILEERDMIHCDELCRIFSDMTGIEIPVVAFG